MRLAAEERDDVVFRALVRRAVFAARRGAAFLLAVAFAFDFVLDAVFLVVDFALDFVLDAVFLAVDFAFDPVFLAVDLVFDPVFRVVDFAFDPVFLAVDFAFDAVFLVVDLALVFDLAFVLAPVDVRADAFFARVPAVFRVDGALRVAVLRDCC